MQVGHCMKPRRAENLLHGNSKEPFGLPNLSELDLTLVSYMHMHS